MIGKKKIVLNQYRFKNIAILVISIILAIIILRSEVFHGYLLHLGKFEYVGAFVAGFFFVSTFTIVPTTIVLFILAETLPVWSIALIAGIGAMLGDLTIFQFFRNNNTDKEILSLFNKMGGKNILHLLHTKHLRWTMLFVGALIIISPLPDELGVSLMGISKLKTRYFLALSYILNTMGIYLLLSAAILIKW